ncbi:MAG: hypothetical protein ACTSPQ_16380 [Candidatus Helarchaeota archaeon]
MSNKEKTSNKCPICGKSTHKESKYCIFMQVQRRRRKRNLR